VLSAVINAIKNCAYSTEGFETTSSEVDVLFLSLLNPFDRTHGLFCGGKVGHNLLTSHFDPEAWLLSAVMNATKNCADCNEGLASSSGEV
jgi:hypothetical protein